MPEAKVTSKGQVTIPKEVREKLQVDAGDRVQFLIRKDGVVELHPQSIALEDLYGLIEYTGEPVTVDEMNRGIASAVSEAYAKSLGK